MGKFQEVPEYVGIIVQVLGPTILVIVQISPKNLRRGKPDFGNLIFLYNRRGCMGYTLPLILVLLVLFLRVSYSPPCIVGDKVLSRL